MPKAVMHNGEITVAKMPTDIESEFAVELTKARNECIHALAYEDDSPDKLTNAKKVLKTVLDRIDAETIKAEAILFNK